MRNILYALLLSAALAPMLLAADFIGIALRTPRVRQDLSLYAQTKSVVTIDYTPFRNPSTYSSLSAKNYSPLSLRKLPGTDRAMPWMPLYVRTTSSIEPSENVEILLFATHDGYLNAYNIKREELVWSLPLPDRMQVVNTPVVDLPKSKIYFLAVPEKRSDPMRLFSCDFHGEHIESIEIQPSDIVADLRLSTLRCTSPLSLITGKYPSIIFSCSAHFKKKKFQASAASILVAIKTNPDGTLASDPNIESLKISDQTNSSSDEPVIILQDQKILIANTIHCLSRFKIEDTIQLEEAWPCENKELGAISIMEKDGQTLAFFSTANRMQQFDPAHFSNHRNYALGSNPLTMITVVNSHYLLVQEESLITVRKIAGREVGEILWSKPSLKMSKSARQLIIQNKQPDQFLYLRMMEASNAPSNLEVIDGSNGNTMQTIELPADEYPSTPLLVDEDIFLSTNSNGILRLSREASLMNLLTSDSFFRALWVNLFAQMKKI